MALVITGTDTDVGKTLISAWLCRHSQWAYHKPVQTGARLGLDQERVAAWAQVPIIPSRYTYAEPYSPHHCAAWTQQPIDPRQLVLPTSPAVVVEGAGGVYVPLTPTDRFIDVFQRWQVPVVIVARTTLGTINHTCLTLAALRHHQVPLAGVILNGEPHPENTQAIRDYGQVPILAEFPWLPAIHPAALDAIPIPPPLRVYLFQERP